MINSLKFACYVQVMDPMRSLLGRVLLEEITLVVMVLSTPLAEEVCKKKNGLNFVEMLLPFSIFNKIDVPISATKWRAGRAKQGKGRVRFSKKLTRPRASSHDPSSLSS
ncbi:hypothetical protein KFK09_007511 [Dendrobium nobile]|uniref:Uncharacterized protein n=1 Tax=Dendrobium nobile TaxID=94219 RepID=A0A8T3BVF6_DENNO|nr:hypothetical protein KFK09_007511 [Dendrobium nobile]